jgi:hypothetical protein
LVPELPGDLDVEEGYAVRSAIADFFGRRLSTLDDKIDPLDVALRGKRKRGSTSLVPYVLERSDVWCSSTHLKLLFRVKEYSTETATRVASEALTTWKFSSKEVMTHVTCCVAQHRLRAYLKDNKLVAFIAKGSILPRKSGASHAPMASPPAVSFVAPSDSDLKRVITFDMGAFKPYCTFSEANDEIGTTMVKISGLGIPAGITWSAGGGYHGKSTLLRCIAAGVYNKIPGDGRELCVTVTDAVSVRAEDGRYVNNCNVSAFISNLPTPPGVTSKLNTKKFSSREASGSTSQAANVSEAMEMGASAMLVDEDVSAANFMARDGRMRALVMDESITPLLYRVNGLYQTHGISSVVVVGGVGDWLDVPHKVILMDKYVACDATAKANSISRQFSYGHVQYGGRGVVHRLEWDNEGTPIPRRPTAASMTSFGTDLSVALFEGGDVLAIERTVETIEDEEDDSGCIDMSRCEQLLGKKAQLYGCGLCVAWIVQQSQSKPELGISELITLLETHLTTNGMGSLASDPILESTGFCYRPRNYEIFMALTRMRGIVFEEMPIVEDDAESAAVREAERKKKELADLWSARRKNNRFGN